MLSLTHKVLTTSQPAYLKDLISLTNPHAALVLFFMHHSASTSLRTV